MALTIDLMRARMYINGKWREADSRFDITNPATGQVVGTVPNGGAREAEEAVNAAFQAFPAWASRTALERSRLLYRWWELIMQHQDDLARILTTEQGKPFAEARGEIAYGADFILWYAEEAKRAYGQTIPANATNKRILAIQQPVGVVAAITPWNFPCAMITRKAGPALAAGCTVLIKPAEQTPLTAIALMDLAEQAGFPAGVINLVTGSAPPIGEVFLTDSRVRKISFTGSTEVGKLLMRRAADQVKRVSMELGGHAPFLVFADADLDAAVQGALASKYRNAGQTCICANRFLVQEEVAEAFAQRLAAASTALKVGEGFTEGAQIGPLIDEAGFRKVETHVADALSKGAKLVCGGQRIGDGPGYFYAPTVLSGVTAQMLVSQEETFGPVSPIRTFRTEEEAVREANDTPYGLAAYAYTRDIGRAIRVAEALDYGIIGLNDGAPSTVQAPFGGYKESGVGREGGRWGMEAFLETKYISMGL